MVDLSGDVAAMGTPPGSEGWRIALDDGGAAGGAARGVAARVHAGTRAAPAVPLGAPQHSAGRPRDNGAREHALRGAQPGVQRAQPRSGGRRKRRRQQQRVETPVGLLFLGTVALDAIGGDEAFDQRGVGGGLRRRESGREQRPDEKTNEAKHGAEAGGGEAKAAHVGPVSVPVLVPNFSASTPKRCSIDT